MIKESEKLERWGEVRIRRHIDGSECDVIVAIGDREMVVQLPNYKLAVKWAQMESRANKVAGRVFGRAPGLKAKKMIRYGAKRPWTSEDDDRLRTLLESGASAAVVAAKLKRTLAATKGRASLLGISFRQIKLGLKAKK